MDNILSCDGKYALSGHDLYIVFLVSQERCEQTKSVVLYLKDKRVELPDPPSPQPKNVSCTTWGIFMLSLLQLFCSTDMMEVQGGK